MNFKGITASSAVALRLQWFGETGCAGLPEGFEEDDLGTPDEQARPQQARCASGLRKLLCLPSLRTGCRIQVLSHGSHGGRVGESRREGLQRLGESRREGLSAQEKAAKDSSAQEKAAKDSSAQQKAAKDSSAQVWR